MTKWTSAWSSSRRRSVVAFGSQVTWTDDCGVPIAEAYSGSKYAAAPSASKSAQYLCGFF